MAPAEAPESRAALRAAGLLAALLTAKALMLAGAPPAWSAWTIVACAWQEVLTALIFYAADRLVLPRRLAWTLYGAVVGYAAINVPIVSALGTPLTSAMLRATRGALADSILHHLTAANVARLALPLVVAAVTPWGLGRRVDAIPRAVLAAALLLVAMGPYAERRADTRGLHRSAVGALIETSLPRLRAVSADADWRDSPFGGRPGTDLTALRGRMAGRNVLIVVLESTGARRLGLYGAERDPMPNLTRLADRSIVFERAYAVYPESIKGLFATLCSRYPAFDTAPELYAEVPCASLPRRLAEAGYRTALFHSGRFGYLGMRSVIERRGFDRLEDAGDIGGVVNSSFGVDEASAVKRVLAWIDSLPRGQRFLATYLPIAGHHPYASSTRGPFEGPGNLPRYLNALHEGDAALGELLHGLEARGLDDETLVIAFGDHAEAFGEHPGNFAHTLFIHEENVRVPYVIAAPGALADQLRARQTASVIDTAPTVLDLLGLPPQPEHQGRSLLHAEPRLALFFTDYSLGWLGLVDSCWKYVYEIDRDRSQLFDVCQDPGEATDQAGLYPDRVNVYRDRVRQWAAAQKDAVTRGR